MIIQGRQREQCQALNPASQTREGKELQKTTTKKTKQQKQNEC